MRDFVVVRVCLKSLHNIMHILWNLYAYLWNIDSDKNSIHYS